MFTSPSSCTHRLSFSCLGFLALLTLGTTHAAPQTRLLVDLSAKPASWGLSAFDLCILRVDAQVDLESAHALGNKCLARVPLFEVATNSPAALRAQQLGVPLLEGSARGMSRLDATHQGWASVVVHEMAEAAAERGFDGVVFSEAETISHDAERAAVLRVLAIMKATYPDKLLFLEGGFDLLSEARRHLDGIVFMEQKGEKEALHLEHRLRESTRQGVQPYVVAFADPEQPSDIAARTARFRELGAVPFFTTAALAGVNLGPLHEITRRVLVLHSGSARASFTAQVLQGSLEWLGYQIIYQDASTGTLADLMPAHIGINAVILDQSLKLGAERQKNLAELVVTLAQKKVPLLITGLPWEKAEDWQTVADALGLQGSGKAVPRPEAATLGAVETSLLMNQGPQKARTQDWRDLRAPAAARVLLSAQAAVKSGPVFDQAFLTTWGGVWLDALAIEAGPQMNPLPLLESWLSAQSVAPVADTTSLDGRRLLVTQITAEGFADTTSLPGLPLASEAMLDRVLMQYALPFTVAVCEGDLRGLTPGHDQRQSLRLQEAARTILGLGQVEAASYSYSLPTSWSGATPVSGVLNATAPKGKVGLEREIAGSLAFIHQQLLGHGRSMSLMSWPQGAVPSPEAVAFSNKMRVENVETIYQQILPGRTPAPAARSWGVGENFQTLIVQTRQGKALDAAAFITEAQRTGQNRWLSPVQASLSFQDAASETSLKQVERLLNWCASQPLQAITAGQYATLSRDAANTRIFQTGSSRWIIVNKGQARTLRLPASAGVPDLARCTGVAGYVQQGDQLYIHTLGLRRTELVMRKEPERDHLRLTSASASIRYLESGINRALLQVSHSRPVEFVFAGIAPGSICQMIANGKPDYLMADTAGRIEFIVPSQATVKLSILATHKSAMR
jgi:polysaccharide biosynthesis protein PelA